MSKKILFVAENVTLAQVVRLKVLASALEPARYEVHFASSAFDPMVFDSLEAKRYPLHTIDKSKVEKALAAGKRLYEKKTLLKYVEADLELIEQIKPDLIVGDFRLSLCVSAPLSRVPHAALVNAYWSPHRAAPSFPVPDHPIIRLLGEQLTEQYFPKALPKVFEHFAAPVNAVRQHYGMEPVGDLLHVLTAGSYTLFPDVPGLVPTRNLPSNQMYLGPVLWSPDVPWSENLPPAVQEPPLIYVTLGSSGKIELLPLVLEALASLPVRAIVATANRTELGRRAGDLPSNVKSFAFVPGALMAQRAALVISNGGSTTGYQALNEGTPVLGIASNLDQYLAMQAIERAGAGLLVKARAATAQGIRNGIRELLTRADYTRDALAVRAEFMHFRAGDRFTSFVESALGPPDSSLVKPQLKLHAEPPMGGSSA